MTATSVQTKQRPWWLTLIMGILAFVVGAILLWAPAKSKVETYQLLIAFLGIYWLIGGIMEIVRCHRPHGLGLEALHGHHQYHRRRLRPDLPGGSLGVPAEDHGCDPGDLGADAGDHPALHGFQGRRLGRRHHGCRGDHLRPHPDGRVR